MTYQYNAEVIRWVDGDSVWLMVDLGFRMSTYTYFRLYGVDTPERGQHGYAEAKAFVEKVAPEGTKVQISTYKDPDKYGRWLAEVTPLGEFGSIPSVNNQIINVQLGKTYFGGAR